MADLKLPEMRSLWVFLILVILLFASDNFLTPLNWTVKSPMILIIGLLIFWNNLRTIKSNKEMKSSALRLRDIVSGLSDAIISYDNNFKLTIINAAAEKLLSLKKEDIVGQYFGPERAKEGKFRILAQILFPSLAPLVIKRSDGDSYPQVFDITFDNPEMNLTVTTIKMLFANNETNGFIKIIHNRTREVELYKSKSEFITVAAHQLRTPLSGINWTFEALSKITTLSPGDKELVQNGALATANTLKIVNDLLDVSKIEEGRFGYNMENMDLVSFLSDILANANLTAKEYGVNLYFDKGTNPSIMVKIDPTKLGIALSNIVDNAIKYNIKNGSITVKLEKLQDKPYAQISVIDTGIGIPASDVGKLFKKFFRAENAVRVRTDGTGLGLYITKNIINRHGGNIWLESELGRGTTVYITLPTDPTLVPPREVFFDESQ
jgi:two-component system sensor histidine kinase VicK